MEYEVTFKLGGKTYWVHFLSPLYFGNKPEENGGYELRETRFTFYYLDEAVKAKNAIPGSKVFWNNGDIWKEHVCEKN